MIGSFWNLCRACPSMPVDKLHSEYRSTYRWHEYTGSRQEVVRQAPRADKAPPAAGDRVEERAAEPPPRDANAAPAAVDHMPKLEPALPRRKKHPELAYRHHQFLSSARDDAVDSSHDESSCAADRARSEERGGSRRRPSRRSKSEGPVRGDSAVRRDRRRDSDPDLENTGRESGLLRKAISKISTEYRLQFAWPHGHVSRRDQVDSNSVPRKSLSMGAIKPAANASANKKRGGIENRDGTSTELEPLVSENTRNEEFRDDEYEYSDGRFTEKSARNYAKITEILPENVKNTDGDSWYREVVELRKKAGQYKHRGWGTELAPETLSEFYNKQIELWDQVSRRSSLSALSLASTTHRSYTKEEKEQENNKRSSPTKNIRNNDNSIKAVRDIVRHHLERTTGGSELDGLILSPTREKLEPTIPRRDENFRSSQKGSPQKYNPQKGSPQKLILQKRNSQKSKNNLKGLRSQSVGPVDTDTDKRSPKRQSRSATTKEKRAVSNSATRRPRPSSLNTSASFRSKCNTIPPHKTEDENLPKVKSNKNQSSHIMNTRNRQKENRKAVDTAVPKNDRNLDNTTETPVVSEPQVDLEDSKPVVKSPPEPTRVKSPEQILMRSPDPVNWTVPLDTGKTFTVTQNIKEGDLVARPHSEVKAWTPPEIPPPVAQSAPPQFTEQTKENVVTTS